MQFPLDDFQLSLVPVVRQLCVGRDWLYPSFIFAHVRIESGFNPTIASSDGLGSIGLMQVLPSTVQQMINEGYVDASQADQAVPANSLAAGTAYLAWGRTFLMTRWNFSTTILYHPVCEGYNLGYGAVASGRTDQRYWLKWAYAQQGYQFLDS